MEKQGKIMGVVPYDFRRPTLARVKERLWNPEDERIVTPRSFGVGWTLNLYQLKGRYPSIFYLLVVTAVVTNAWRLKKFLSRRK